MDNFEQSRIPFPERNEAILQGLVGCKVPNFNVRTINGESVTLSELKGKVVVINFWFEACAPCIAEIPALNRLKEDYRTKDVDQSGCTLNRSRTKSSGFPDKLQLPSVHKWH